MSKLSDQLQSELKNFGQFPYGKRDRAYQTIGDHKGIRDMEHRFEVMDFPDSFEGKTVIDIGCSVGAICIEAKKRGAKRVVGIDYKKETVDVAKKVASEYNLDIEYYTFDVNRGLDALKGKIRNEKFDYTFALSIWGHVDKQELSDIINYYTNDICWFEGHGVGWTGDTKSKMEQSFDQMLKYSEIKHLGETNDRSVRQNFKLFYKKSEEETELIKVKLGKDNQSTYFGGDEYEFIVPWDRKRVESEDECNSEKYNVTKKDRYCFQGQFCRFLGSKDEEYGYKVFTDELDRKEINLLFDIQEVLFNGGFAPRPHEIIKCCDDTREYFAIKMDNIRGTHVRPDNKWIKDLVGFCENNKIHREIRSVQMDCVPKNCIKTDNGEIYLVDIDQRYRMETEVTNVVFIPNIDLGDNRNKSYSYSINSWKHFCDKYDCELLVWEDLLLPVEQMKITWQRYYLFDILEANNIDYDQILIVDADTIVHPDCPNFFTETNGKYSVVRNNGSFEWVRKSMDGFSKLLFNDEVLFKVWDYINCGFQIVNKDHKEFFEYVRNYYLENQYEVQNAIDQVKAGTDQTIVNFLLRKQNIELNYLSSCYNLQDLHSKQLLFIHPQMWFEDKLIFENCGYVFHFNAIPRNEMGRDTNYWIKRTYEEFYK